LIHQALKRLEYRGYDSAGIATTYNGILHVKKDKGKIDEVHSEVNLDDLPGNTGIGHTRWATHGGPSMINAHPHVDCNWELAVVHNGIIENFLELKSELEEAGHKFVSKTDSEVIPHLIEQMLKEKTDFVEAVRMAVKRLEGSYAIAVLYTKEPDVMVCARNESPLTIGVNDEECYCASDIPAFLPLTNRAIVLQNGEMAVIGKAGCEVLSTEDGSPVARKPEVVEWAPEMAEKQGYPHFMIKEIHEQPQCLKDTLRLQEPYLDLMTTFLDRAHEVFMVASGTSYHACLAASYMFSKLTFLSMYPVMASEFIEQYGRSVNIDSTILAVSQSGETADTLQAVDHARFHAATVLGLTNVLSSTITRVSRVYICHQSGPEIGVAATKTFTSQLSVLAQLALRLAQKRGKASHTEIEVLQEQLEKMPEYASIVIDRLEGKVKEIVNKYHDKPVFFFLGKGISYATALEGRLKLLEISYIPAIAYPAGESKHGPISLVEKGFPVVFVCPKDGTRKTVIGNIMEMKARGASVIALIEEGDEEVKRLVDDYLEVVKGIPEVLSPIVYVIPLQLFAYYVAVKRGLDPDKPRNLAKSVTVR